MNEYKYRQRFHALALGTTGIFTGALIQYLPFTARKLGATITMIAMLTALPRIAQLTALLYAHLFKNLPSTLRYSIPRIIACFILLALTLTTSPTFFVSIGMIGSFFLMISETFYGKLIDDLYPPSHRGRFLSLPMTIATFTTITSNFIAGRLLDLRPDNYHKVFLISALLGIIGGLLFLKIPVSVASAKSKVKLISRDVLTPLRDKPFLLWTLLYTLTTLPYWFVVPAKPVFFNDELGINYTAFGTIMVMFNGATLLAILFSGKMIDRWGSPIMMAVSWSGIGISYLILGLSHTFPLALLTQLIEGVSMGINDIAWYPAVLGFAPRQKVNQYIGVYMTFYGLRAVIGPLVGGILINSLAGGSRTTLLISGLLITSLAILIALSHKQLKSSNYKEG